MKKLSKTKLEAFIEKSLIKHNNFYDYSKVNYIDAHTKVIINCPKHGEFEQLPTNHLYGYGCKKCGTENSAKLRSNFSNFISAANVKHHNKYDYSKSLYVNNYTKVIINCPEHGEFEQIPNNHLMGKGCFQCMVDKSILKNSKSVDLFIQQAKVIHNCKYDYSKVIYKNSFVKIIIICDKHGDFMQLPVKHLCGQGCPICVNTISKSEIKWLDALCVSTKFRHKTLKINNKNYMVDAYDPQTNIIYEFYGDYWHGNPRKYKNIDFNMVNKKSFGELYSKTIKRENILKQAGYKLITIWEMDF